MFRLNRGARRARGPLLLLLLIVALWGASGAGTVRGEGGNHALHLPLVARAEPPLEPPLLCDVATTSYQGILTFDAPEERPDTVHADLNLGLRGYEPTNASLALVSYDGPVDEAPPQLSGIFADRRAPQISAAYRVYDWNWDCNCRGPLIPYPGYPNGHFPVTLMQLQSSRGETLHLPDRAGGHIDAAGYKALVIFAAEDRLTLKYTRNDDVVQGYTLHVEGICVEPRLLALYREGNAGGRDVLPALRPGQPLGRAGGGAVGIAIRDNGTFMDPRSRRDWWHGY